MLKRVGYWIGGKIADLSFAALVSILVAVYGISVVWFKEFFRRSYYVPGWAFLVLVTLLVILLLFLIGRRFEKLVILAAAFGAGKQWVGRTKIMSSKIADGQLRDFYAGVIRSDDPCYGTPKKIVVIYSYRHQIYAEIHDEGTTFSLP